MSIATIFEARGEAAFRNLEARVLESFLANTVASVLSRTGMDPLALVLEITENVLIEESDRTMTALGLRETFQHGR